MTALYRVEVARDLHHAGWPYTASVYPIDGLLAGMIASHHIGESREEVVKKAADWIAAEGAKPANETLYMDHLGHEVPAP